jgi:hypothetical protein
MKGYLSFPHATPYRRISFVQLDPTSPPAIAPRRRSRVPYHRLFVRFVAQHSDDERGAPGDDFQLHAITRAPDVANRH